MPIKRGKGLFQRLGIILLGQNEIVANSLEGTQFLLSFPEDRGWECLYFQGTCEKGTTKNFKQIVQCESIVFDIGANIGWFTILAAQRTSHGHCHAFEPVPFLFKKLEKNCDLNAVADRVTLNPTALGDAHRTLTMHTFEDLPHGHSSLSSLGRTDARTFTTPMITMSEYLLARRIFNVDVIKLDVEGAELSVLQGASELWNLSRPPIWMVEMNEETAREFSYRSSDVLTELLKHGSYYFFRIIGAWGTMKAMRDIRDYAHGDNVFCVPLHRSDVLASFRSQSR